MTQDFACFIYVLYTESMPLYRICTLRYKSFLLAKLLQASLFTTVWGLREKHSHLQVYLMYGHCLILTLNYSNMKHTVKQIKHFFKLNSAIQEVFDKGTDMEKLC